MDLTDFSCDIDQSKATIVKFENNNKSYSLWVIIFVFSGIL